MKLKADEHRREVEFAVGDMVFLKIRPYRQKSLARRANEKLAARFYGPFEVEARVGPVAYRLKLPAGSKIHNTFHVSQIKKVVGEIKEFNPLPTHLSSEGVLEAEPEEVWDTRVNQGTGQEEVLVKWRGLPAFDCTWEWKSTILKQFPYFDLEDKVNLEGKGNDTYEANHPPTLYQYTRRKAQTK